MAQNKNVGYGAALLYNIASKVPSMGRIFVVSNGTSDYADYTYQALSQIFTPAEGVVRFYTDLATAVANVTSNNNDVILLDAHTSHKVTSMLTVSANRVHFFGMDGSGRIEDQRCLISNNIAGAATDTAMVKVTGTGVTFRNIKFANNFTVANNLYCVDDQGTQGLFENCSFQNLGSAHLTNNACASLRLSSDTTFYKHCTIGQSELKITSTGGQQMLVAIASSVPARNITMEDCQFKSYTSDTTHVAIRVNANGDIDRSIRLVNPAFLNFNYDASNGGAQLATAIATPSGLISGGILVEAPRMLFITKLAVSTANKGVYVCLDPAPVASTTAAILTTA